MSLAPDAEVLLLFATSMAAKRRPAELVDIVAALALVSDSLPRAEKISETFASLGMSGLLVSDAGCFSLTPAAEQAIEALPRKGEPEDLLRELRRQLDARVRVGEPVVLAVTTEAVRDALSAHRAAASSTAKNLLMPKPKPENQQARPGQRQRKPIPKARKR